MKRLKSISRIDARRAKGWYVRVAASGKVHGKFFSDSKFKGKKTAALNAAIKWRDDMEKKLGKPRTDRTIVMRGGKRPRGVRKTMKAGRPVYEVTWSPKPGKISRTTFSITLYGAKGARDLAEKLREDMEKKYYGYR